MKVLTIKEPWATLIIEGYKKYEFRSWKTNYRGKLLIHASSTKIPKEWRDNKELMKLVEDKKLNYGKIVCSCELVDCIYMDKNFIKNIKENNQEYLCGIYEEGRYAWILQNIEIVNSDKKVKGHLGIWNYDF